MTGRERLQCCYELAFHPPRLNALWQDLKAGRVGDRDAVGDMLDTAWLLHQALPTEGHASQRALNRLALFQARARAFGMPRTIRNIRRYLRRPPLRQTEVPAHLVRDIGLPKLSRTGLDRGPVRLGSDRRGRETTQPAKTDSVVTSLTGRPV